uniref:V-type proton ATPase proteolipid subunit n=1 Tax=Eutreptiella gymnastica TaxID=73025 RepID=A0A7S1IHK6_9EUGL
MGVVVSLTFCTLGAAYGMAKSALGVVRLAHLAPSAIFRGLIPVIMAELLAIYGFITSLNIISGFEITKFNSFSGYLDFGAGLVVGLSCLASGLSIGAIAEANIKSYGHYIRRSEKSTETEKEKKKKTGGLADAAGTGYGTVDKSVTSHGKNESNPMEDKAAAARIMTAKVLMLIFAEGIGLYGMIVGLLMHNAASQPVPDYMISPPVFAFPEDPCGSATGAFFGGAGVVVAVGGALAGASMGISRSGVGAAHLAVRCIERVLRGTTPVVMSELLAIYGFVAGLVIALGINADSYTAFSGYLDFAAGCSVGFGCLGSGFAIGCVGDACNRVYSKQDKIFSAMVLILIFAEALGLYSLIVGLSLHNNGLRGLCSAHS